ncbi:unnamed protein product [Heterobilharzia americana]|nr:unnamed protein product [Heterobilharzia americana]
MKKWILYSKTVQSDIKDIAEFLYNVLVDKDFIKNRAKLLIACNKQDTATAKGISVITNLLEKELNTLTFTRTGALAGLDHSTTRTLTKPGVTFTFSRSRFPVEFVEISATNNISVIHKWLMQL